METSHVNGYVLVKFTDWGKSYWYMIPPYIKVSDVQNYVVVEDAFYKKDSTCPPYKIAKVVNVVDDCAFGEETASQITKYIAAAINSNAYVEVRDHDRIVEDITTSIKKIIDEASIEERVGIMATFALFGNDNLQQACNDFINENYNKIQRVM